MADTEGKPEVEEVEKILGEDTVQGEEDPKKEDEQENLEDVLGEGGDVGDGNGGASGANEEHQNGKGDWRTSLPKELRDGIDVEKYHSITEYITALREEAGANAHPEMETDEAWTSLESELAGNDESDEMLSGSLGTMREAGLSTEQAKLVHSKMREAINAYAEGKANAIKEGLVEYQMSMVGKDKAKLESFKATLRRGMNEVSRENPELFKKGKDDSIFLHPTVANLLYMVGRYSEEGLSPEDRRGSEVKSNVTADNPFGLH